MRKISICILAISMTSCATTDVPDPVRDRIALCNAGMSVQLTAKVEATLAENIKDGVKIDAGVGNELRGLLLNSDKVTSQNVDAMYAKYLTCIMG